MERSITLMCLCLGVILQLLIYIRSNFIFALQKCLICKERYIFKEKYTFKVLSNFLFPSRLTWMKFGFSHSRPKLWKWFLVFPVPVLNYWNGFLYFPFPSRTPWNLFSFLIPSQNAKKLFPLMPAISIDPEIECLPYAGFLRQDLPKSMTKAGGVSQRLVG